MTRILPLDAHLRLTERRRDGAVLLVGGGDRKVICKPRRGEADYRLNVVKMRLGYAPTDELAPELLRQAHAQFVPKALRETPIPAGENPPG